MKNNFTISFTLICESVSALASEPTTGDLKVLQRNLEACTTTECDYLTRLFRFELGRFLIEDARPKLDSPKHGLGLEDCQALLALYDKLGGLEGFSAMPKFEALYDGAKIISCDVTVEKEIKDSLATCSTPVAVERIFDQIVRALEKHPDERAPLLYYTVTRIHKEIMGAGVDYIEGSLSDDEKLRYSLYRLVSALASWEFPLFLYALNISDGEASATMPGDIPKAATVEELTAGIESLKRYFRELSPACYAAQLRSLVPALRNQITKELTMAVRELSPDLPQGLKYKLNLLHKELRKRWEKLGSAEQYPTDCFAIADFIQLARKLCGSRSSEESKRILDELFRKLENHSDFVQAAYDMTSEYLVDNTFAALYFEIDELGFMPTVTTLAKIMLYYSMRFAASGGDWEFWDTPFYAPLMAQAEV